MDTPDAANRAFFSLEQTWKYFGVSRTTLHEWRKTGRIKVVDAYGKPAVHRDEIRRVEEDIKSRSR